MKRVLVTGAAGFIGRQTLPFLRARGFEVHAADHRSVGAPDVVEHEVDLRDGRAVERLVAAVHPTHVLHLAWCTAHGEFWNSSENLDWVAGGVALIRAVEKTGGGRIVAAGSSAEYGAAGRCVEDETPIEPGTLYGTAKNAFRELLFARARLGGIQAVWGRVFLAYGPFEKPERLVPSVVRSLLRGETAACTHGEQLRDVLHVADVASAFVHLLDSDATGAFNVCSGEPIRLRTVVERIAERMGRPDLVAFGALPQRPGEPAVLYGSAERLERSGWSPGISLGAGIEETVAWWRRQETGASER